MLLPELWTLLFAHCSSKDRSILCQVSKTWCTMTIRISSQLSPFGHPELVPLMISLGATHCNYCHKSSNEH